MDALPTSPCPSPTDDIFPEQVAALRAKLRADLLDSESSPARPQVKLCPTVQRLLASKRNRRASGQAV